jgi:hypothetical protein
MLSNLPSQTQQQIEILRPIVKERLAKMEAYGEHWDDKPVCQTIVTVSGISLHDWFAERYAHVAHERGQRCGKVPRRLGTAIAPGQCHRYTFNSLGE